MLLKNKSLTALKDEDAAKQQYNEDIQRRSGTNEMKTLIVFIHTKLMNFDVVLAVPHWQAKYSKVFTSVSEDYVPYTPVRFDLL